MPARPPKGERAGGILSSLVGLRQSGQSVRKGITVNELLVGMGVAYLLRKLEEHGEAKQEAQNARLARMIAAELRGAASSFPRVRQVVEQELTTRVIMQDRSPTRVVQFQPTYRVVHAEPILVSVRAARHASIPGGCR